MGSREEGQRKTTLRLFERLEHSYPESRIIHLILDNARYHQAKLPRPFLERPECRIRLHFLPAYAPQRTDSSGLNPIERLWGVMHRQVTHNRCYPDFHQFAEAIFGFFDRTLPENWHTIRSTVTDNFRVITHDQFRLIGWQEYNYSCRQLLPPALWLQHLLDPPQASRLGVSPAHMPSPS